ncbi:HTH-type transcriptional regulator HdfR [Paraburkholderia ultramafica]|uniref:HTH-type transcriptional regulator HdfR n=1 Tax=Paraburkholderia ultramafica TaxID=1544867 RepID=A0A6S7BJH5_9BURK|nr:LysR family transcriptional regulator [Paraburkholderia ultramafica]CAB3802480.1 HTH-type transcriptional regulator HdfR [Paraburkholderia ultramafica]
MTLQQLETFFWTASLGSFSAAAERLYATQSAVSMRVRELERTLGVELFDRTHRTARLTSKGRELMEYASRILDLSTELEHRLASPESVVGTVRFGVAEVITTTWLPELIRTIAERHPKLRLEIEEALTGELMDSLLEAELDLVLAPGHPSARDLSTLSLGRVAFEWMASPTLGLEDRVYGPAELAEHPIIGMKSESFHYSAIEDWFQNQHARCRYLARCKSVAVAASMTMAGMGVAYLPAKHYADEIDAGKLKVIRTVPRLEPVQFVAVFPLGHSYSLARTVAELAAEVSTFDRQ